MYLTGIYFKKPKDPKRTREKGYMLSDTNFSFEESLNICKRLKPRDHAGCQVILDLVNKKVVKNNFNNNFDFESLLLYYQQGYPDYLNPVLAKLYKEDIDAIRDVQQKEEENSRP